MLTYINFIFVQDCRYDLSSSYKVSIPWVVFSGMYFFFEMIFKKKDYR